MAANTTPADFSGSSRNRSLSRSRSSAIPSRPTTPLRPPSRTSLRASQSTPTAGSSIGPNDHPLNILEHAFSELSDGMADLEANFMHLSLLHESLGRFNENFGAFLYGLNMSAFCVDFPEAPITQSFTRHKDHSGYAAGGEQSSMFQSQAGGTSAPDTEATFLTSDTSFVENPPPTTVKSSKFSSVPSSTATPRARNARGSVATTGRGRAGIGTSGIGRGGPSARGGAANTGSRIGRGVGRSRGVR